MRFQTSTPREPMVDLTPMIDLVFNLLIFFVVTTTFVTAPGIKVQLPKGTSEEISRPEEVIHLTITAAGKVFLGAEAVDENALSRAFRAGYERDVNTTVMIHADQGSTHGRVVHVMDLARRAQLSRIAIATEKVRE